MDCPGLSEEGRKALERFREVKQRLVAISAKVKMQGSREFVLRLEGILPTGLCLSFGFLFFGIFSYAAFLGPPVAQQTTSCAGAAAKRSSSLWLSRIGLELASHDQVGIGQIARPPVRFLLCALTRTPRLMAARVPPSHPARFCLPCRHTHTPHLPSLILLQKEKASRLRPRALPSPSSASSPHRPHIALTSAAPHQT